MVTDMDRKAEIDARVNQLRAAMGRALWEAQGVEQIVAKYYAIAFKLSTAPTLEEINKAFEENFTHTAGRLIGVLKKAAGDKDVAAEKLESFVAERNWLVHKLRREEYLSLASDEGFTEVIARVQALEASSIELILIFHEKLVQYFVSLGTPRDLIEREQAKTLKEIYGEKE
jgi:hypothetical protein